jgi:hypothetical protein
LSDPLLEHYGIELWMPEAGGRVNFTAEGDEQLMLSLGVQPKREITRIRYGPRWLRRPKSRAGATEEEEGRRANRPSLAEA